MAIYLGDPDLRALSQIARSSAQSYRCLSTGGGCMRLFDGGAVA